PLPAPRRAAAPVVAGPHTNPPRRAAGVLETVPKKTASRRNDRRVDTDDIAVKVEGWPAGMSSVDRRIDLNQILISACSEVALASRDDPSGYRPAKSERVADG